MPPRLEASLPGPWPLAPADELVEHRRLRRAGRRRLRRLHRLHQPGGAAPASGLRRHARRRRRHLRDARSSWSTAASRRRPCTSSTGTRATASTSRATIRIRSTRSPTRPSRSRTGSRAAIPATSTTRATEDRHMLIVDRDNRYLYELYNVWYDRPAAVAGGSGAFFDLNDQRPPARGLDLGRRRGPRDPARPACATTRSTGPDEIRHAFRFTVRAHQRLRVPGLAPGRAPGPAGARRWARGCG